MTHIYIINVQIPLKYLKRQKYEISNFELFLQCTAICVVFVAKKFFELHASKNISFQQIFEEKNFV